MKIIRRSEATGGGEPGRDTFSGQVDLRPIHQVPGPAGVSVVRFHGGARTHWHAHAGGQVLHVLEGAGRVQSEGGPVEVLAPGDFVVAEPDEKHWHGAAEGADMAHISIAIGGVEWMGAVS